MEFSSDPPAVRPQTLIAQGLGRVADPYRDIVPPIHVSTTYERSGDGSYPGGRIYSRPDNPSFDQVEALIASLEHASSALVFASGQAAAAAVLQSLAPGDAVLAPRNMYWGLRNWMSQFTTTWQLPLDFYENASIDDLAARTRARRPRLVWIETPANPTWDVTDIAAASALAREVGAAVAVDSTAATPLLTRPLELGADIVMHSATKYLNGHSDVIAGALAGAHDDELWHRIRQTRSAGGAVTVRGVAAAARDANAARARCDGVCECAGDRRAAGRASTAFARPLSGVARAPRACRRGEADARRIRRHDVAASARRRGGGEALHRELARVQARHVARLGGE